MSLNSKLLPKLNEHPAHDLVPRLPSTAGIPRVIHQVFPTAALPQALLTVVEKNKAINPEWEHRLYSDEDMESFIQKEYGSRILNDYLRINPKYGPARADLFRYLLLYKIGGVYLDIKSSMSKPLEAVIRADDSFILSFWSDSFTSAGIGRFKELDPYGGREFQQWFIVATPGHPFLKAVADSVLQNIGRYHPELHGVGKKGVLRLTGPIAYTAAIQPLLALYPHRFADSNLDLGFEYSIFMGSGGFDGHSRFFKHHYAKLRESIIPINMAGRVLAVVIRAARFVRNFFRPRPRP